MKTLWNGFVVFVIVVAVLSVGFELLDSLCTIISTLWHSGAWGRTIVVVGAVIICAAAEHTVRKR